MGGYVFPREISAVESAWLLEAVVPEPRLRDCCAGCRRGTRAFGVLPCGRALRCRCHETPNQENGRQL